MTIKAFEIVRKYRAVGTFELGTDRPHDPSGNVYVRFDGDYVWDSTPFQICDQWRCRKPLDRLVADWLQSQAG